MPYCAAARAGEDLATDTCQSLTVSYLTQALVPIKEQDRGAATSLRLRRAYMEPMVPKAIDSPIALCADHGGHVGVGSIHYELRTTVNNNIAAPRIDINSNDWREIARGMAEAFSEAIRRDTGAGYTSLAVERTKSNASLVLVRETVLEAFDGIARGGSEGGRMVLEGGAGSGKSLQMCQLAHELALRCSRSSGEELAPLPLLLNLRDYTRRRQEEDVGVFVLEQAAKMGRFPETLLRDGFAHALCENRFVLLFDSFDEIPSILHEVGDEPLQEAADMLALWLQNKCAARTAAVVASRPLHGRISWPVTWAKLAVQPLTESQRLVLINQVAVEEEALRRLVLTESLWHIYTGNPLFLSLICNHVRHTGAVPASPYELFRDYVARTVALATRSRPELANCTPETCAEIALQIWRCNSEQRTYHVPEALAEFGRALVGAHFAIMERDRRFSFRLRRVQEYLLAMGLLNGESLVTADAMLRQIGWRDTLILMLQCRREDSLPYGVSDALLRIAAAWPDAEAGDDNAAMEGEEEEVPLVRLAPVRLPAGVNYVLHILTEANLSCAHLPPLLVKRISQRFVEWEMLDAIARQEVLQLCPLVPQEVAGQAIEKALQAPSLLLNDAAFTQLARLGALTDNTAALLHAYLLCLPESRPFAPNVVTVETYLQRIPGTAPLAWSFKMLRWRFYVRYCLCAASIVWQIIHMELHDTSWGDIVADSTRLGSIVILCEAPAYLIRRGVAVDTIHELEIPACIGVLALLLFGNLINTARAALLACAICVPTSMLVGACIGPAFGRAIANLRARRLRSTLVLLALFLVTLAVIAGAISSNLVARGCAWGLLGLLACWRILRNLPHFIRMCRAVWLTNRRCGAGKTRFTPVELRAHLRCLLGYEALEYEVNRLRLGEISVDLPAEEDAWREVDEMRGWHELNESRGWELYLAELVKRYPLRAERDWHRAASARAAEPHAPE